MWALKEDAKDRPGYGDVVQVLSAGRTSVVTDPSFDPAFYRLAGYRLLGRRAVRIDILERLADLIRPALGWKPGTGTRPDGAYDGTRFVVTPSMMSILGATADDMEEILKSLGYRPEAVDTAIVAAKLVELDATSAPAARPESSETAPAEGEAPTAADTAETPVEEQAEPDEPAAELAIVAPVVMEDAPKPILLWRQAAL